MSGLPIHGLDATGQVTDTFYALFVVRSSGGRRPRREWHLVAMLDTETAARTEATRRIYHDAEEDIAIARVGATVSVDPTTLLSLRAESKREMLGVQSCRACACTDDDNSGCIERTGRPCYWVEPDLCSACATDEQKKASAERLRDRVRGRRSA